MSTANPPTEPVIIIGASRSGTGLMVRVLAENGYATGDDLSANHESWFFQRLNRWMLTCAGAGLETPEAIDVLLNDPFARAATVAVVRANIEKQPHTGLWTFKDPRNTFTLPLWLDLFPHAKVIHMLRHGVDAAASLVARRSRVELKWNAGDVDTIGRLNADLVEQQRVVANLRVRTLDEAFVHWRTYVRRAMEHCERLGPQCTTIRYEDLLREPDAVAATLSTFLGRRIALGGVPLHSARAFAHQRTPELDTFARVFATPDLASVGYGDPTRDRASGCCVWLTGLSGAGKTTTAAEVFRLLRERGESVVALDGDVVRQASPTPVGFSRDERAAHVRSIGARAREIVESGSVAVCAVLSPHRDVRLEIRESMGARFVEVYVATPRAVCEQRDPKGLYAKARAGELPTFLNADARYEAPLYPDLRIDTVAHSAAENAALIVAHLLKNGLIQ